MAIRFACQCGKPLQAQDNFAGRKMRCPACGNVLTIPDGNAQTDVLPTAAASAPAKVPAPTAVDPPAAAPAKKKPALPAALTEEAVAKAAPPKRALAARVDDDDEVMDIEDADVEDVMGFEDADEEPEMFVRRRPRKAATRRPANVWADPTLAQELTPWPAADKARVGAISERKRSGSGGWLFLFLLLVAGCAAAAWVYGDDIKKALDANANYLKERAKAPPPPSLNPWANFVALDLLPADLPYVISVRPADAWAKAKKLALPPQAKQLLNAALDDLVRQANKQAGLPPEQIEQVLVFGKDSPLTNPQAGPPLILVQTLKPFDKDKLKSEDGLRNAPPDGNDAPPPVVKKILGNTTKFLNEKLLLFGPTEEVAAFVAAPPAKKMVVSSQRAALLNLCAIRPLAVSVVITPALKQQALGMIDLPNLFAGFKVFFEANAVDATVDADKNLKLDVFLHFTKAKQAQGAATALTIAKFAIGFAPQDMQKKPEFIVARELLANLKHKVSDDTLELHWKLDAVTRARLLKAIGELQQGIDFGPLAAPAQVKSGE